MAAAIAGDADVGALIVAIELEEKRGQAELARVLCTTLRLSDLSFELHRAEIFQALMEPLAIIEQERGKRSWEVSGNKWGQAE